MESGNRKLGNELRVGDIVALKSDGPKMTVTHVSPAWITCAWFAGDDAVHSHSFPPDTLKRVGS